MRIGIHLSCEEYAPDVLLEQARLADEAGMHGLWISDHYHPWLDVQGQSPFVWSVIGALSEVSRLPIMTAVTCPTVRLHPAIVAQAAATSAVMTGGRFILGVGSGEALNEAVTGQRWPDAGTRLSMLEEAVEVIRQLWHGGVVNHHGRHYTVEHARLYTLPSTPPQLYVSGLGQRSTELAARIGDGYVTTSPDPDLAALFREKSGGKPVTGGGKACYAKTEEQAVAIAHAMWPTSGLPGEAHQVLPSPAHFEQLSTLVKAEAVAKAVPCGPDPERHIAAAREYQRAGFDELYVAPIGPHYREMIDLYASQVAPAVA